MLEDIAPLPVAIMLAAALVMIAVWHLWYAWALAQVLAAHETPTWRAWVPVLNEAEVLRLGRVDPVKVALLFVPLVAVYPLVLKALAAHRIGARYGRGAGTTVLAVLLPPVWATSLAGAAPAPERASAADDDEEPVLLVAPTPAPLRAPAAPPAPALPSAPAAPSAPAPPAPAVVDEVPGLRRRRRPAADPVDTASAPAPALPEEQTRIARRVPAWQLVLPSGEVVALTARTVVLGRRPDDDDVAVQRVAVADDTRTVSKRHARLDRVGDGWTLTDLASTNGVALVAADRSEQRLPAGVSAPVNGVFLLGDARLVLRTSEG